MNNHSPHTVRVPLHRMLRQRREELQLNQAEIAEALQVTPESIGLWERGARRISLDRLPRLAQVLCVDPKGLCLAALAEFHPCFHAALCGPLTPDPSDGAAQG